MGGVVKRSVCSLGVIVLACMAASCGAPDAAPGGNAAPMTGAAKVPAHADVKAASATAKPITKQDQLTDAANFIVDGQQLLDDCAASQLRMHQAVRSGNVDVAANAAREAEQLCRSGSQMLTKYEIPATLPPQDAKLIVGYREACSAEMAGIADFNMVTASAFATNNVNDVKTAVNWGNGIPRAKAACKKAMKTAMRGIGLKADDIGMN